MKLNGNFEVPDNCPWDCPLKPEATYQGCYCSRCPIFNCKKTPDSSVYADKDGFFQLMKPEEYRKDWGKEWYIFFKNWEQHVIKRPILYLIPPKGEDRK
jgi:hypothetical protein